MPETIIEPKIAAAIQLAIRDLDFGTVEIVVHDSRVVQVDIRRRIRFDKDKRRDAPDHRE